jgi:hypothetical protein
MRRTALPSRKTRDTQRLLLALVLSFLALQKYKYWQRPTKTPSRTASLSASCIACITPTHALKRYLVCVFYIWCACSSHQIKKNSSFFLFFERTG